MVCTLVATEQPDDDRPEEIELTREAILSANDLKAVKVPVPEWGGVVYVGVMTGAERDSFEAQRIDQRGSDVKVNLDNVRAHLAARTLCDSQGKRLFSVKDVVALGQKSGAALQRVYEAAMRINRVTADDVEELAGN